MRPYVLVIALFSVGCAGAKPSGNKVPAAEKPRDSELITYRFSLDTEPEAKLTCELEVQGEEDGTTQFGVYDKWAAVDKVHQSVSSPRAVGPDDQPLPVAEMQMHENAIAYWTVTHEPGAVIRFRWEMTNDHEAQRKSTRYLYGPVVRPDVVHFLGHFLVYPVGVPPAESTVSIGFGSLGEQWKSVSSFHAEGSGFERRMRVDHLRNAVFYAGKDLRVLERKVGANSVFAALTGTYRFTDEEFADLLQKVIQGQRDFFADHSQPQFVATILPNDAHVNPDTPEGAQMGVALHNSFAAFIRPTASLKSAGSAYELKNLFAHELLHYWIGPRIYMTRRPSGASWFKEGFTTYMAGELMRDQGIIPMEQYLRHIDSYVVGYQKSKFRTATNAEAAEAFWKGNEGHDIAYVRGAVLAAFLDRELRQTSNGERRLEHFLRDMLAQAGPLDEAKLMAFVEAQTSAEFAKWYRARAIDGLGMDLPGDLFGERFVSKTDKDGIVTYVEAKRSD